MKAEDFITVGPWLWISWGPVNPCPPDPSVLCSEVMFRWFDLGLVPGVAPAAIERCHDCRWLTETANDADRARRFVRGSVNGCSVGPTCGT